MEYVFIEQPIIRCPVCKSTALTAYSSRRESDGSRWRHTRCRTCGEKFIVVIERIEQNRPKLGLNGKTCR